MNQTTGVLGQEELAPKRSAVDERGALRDVSIDGVRLRTTRPVPHEDGYLTEIARVDWEVLQAPVVQVHVTTTFPDRIRAWGLHESITDRLFVVAGLVRIAIFDGREGSPTLGRLNEFVIGERNPALLIIPPRLYHGWKNVGTTEAIVLNMPDHVYNYDAPDALHLPWDCDAAKGIIPYSW